MVFCKERYTHIELWTTADRHLLAGYTRDAWIRWFTEALTTGWACSSSSELWPDSDAEPDELLSESDAAGFLKGFDGGSVFFFAKMGITMLFTKYLTYRSLECGCWESATILARNNGTMEMQHQLRFPHFKPLPMHDKMSLKHLTKRAQLTPKNHEHDVKLTCCLSFLWFWLRWFMACK